MSLPASMFELRNSQIIFFAMQQKEYFLFQMVTEHNINNVNTLELN